MSDIDNTKSEINKHNDEKDAHHDYPVTANGVMLGAGLSANGDLIMVNAQGGFSYVQPPTPDNPEEGDLWFDTDAGESGQAKVYDGEGWIVTSIADHSELSGITGDSHHPYPIINAGLAGYPWGGNDLSFNPVTDTQLTNHASDTNAHHSPPTQTQNNSESGEWILYGEGDANNTWNLSGTIPARDIRLTYTGGSSVDYIYVNYTDGSQYQNEGVEGFDNTYFETGTSVTVTGVNKVVESIESEGTVKLEIRYQGLPAHNHNI